MKKVLVEESSRSQLQKEIDVVTVQRLKTVGPLLIIIMLY